MNEENAFVFVVDDDMSVRESLRNSSGRRVQRADIFVGARVFGESASGGPGCLVLDVQLPG